MSRIFTHINPDLDAHSSCWAVRRFVPGMSNAPIIYIGADWDGSGMEPGDIAVDLNAGGKGIKGILDSDGTVHSSFAYIVSRYASREDAEDIKDLVSFVDMQDAYGSVVNYMVRNRMIMETTHDARRLIAVNSIGSDLRALEYLFPDEPEKVFSRMCDIFDGRLLMGRANRRAEIEADKAQLFANGRVALVRGKKEKRTSHILWERGVEAFVYIDELNLGVVRRGDGALLRDGKRFRADHPAIRNVVKDAGEINQWFDHPKGFLYCHGSRKAPAHSMSNVNPLQLIEVVSRLHQ